MDGGSGYLSQSAYGAHFGLGAAIAGGATGYDVALRVAGAPAFVTVALNVRAAQVVAVALPGACVCGEVEFLSTRICGIACSGSLRIKLLTPILLLTGTKPDMAGSLQPEE